MFRVRPDDASPRRLPSPLRHLRSALVTALLVGAMGCSDSEGAPPGGGGSGGGGSGGSQDATAGSAGAAGTSGASASAGASGSAGGSGSAGASGAAGAEEGSFDPDAVFPVPDKLAALTFDDGPDATRTAAVLDKLEFHQVPASFFLIGQRINAGAQAVLERAAALGCEFENHSFGFASLTGLTPEAIATSVNDTTAAIEQFTDDSPEFFRPPNLAIDAQMYELIDFPFAGGVVGGDFPAEFGGNPTVDAVSNVVLTGVRDGSIILLHDVQDLNPHPTPDALDIIIPELKRQGYELVTLRQLFARRGVDPNGQQDTIWNVVPPAN